MLSFLYSKSKIKKKLYKYISPIYFENSIDKVYQLKFFVYFLLNLIINNKFFKIVELSQFSVKNTCYNNSFAEGLKL